MRACTLDGCPDACCAARVTREIKAPWQTLPFRSVTASISEKTLAAARRATKELFFVILLHFAVI
jgi:hypothetical protein